MSIDPPGVSWNETDRSVSNLTSKVQGVSTGSDTGRPAATVPVEMTPPTFTNSAKERILDTAYALFCMHGIQSVGVDAIIERSGAAKATVYRHFSSKEALALAVLERRERCWTHDWLEAEVCARSADPAQRLLTVFDVFDEWFNTESFEGCFFINSLLEFDDRTHALHGASADHLARIRELVAGWAAAAGVVDSDGFARQWHILMKGSIVAAQEGDLDAAVRAKAVGRLLLAEALD